QRSREPRDRRHRRTEAGRLIENPPHRCATGRIISCRHPGEGRDLTRSVNRTGEIPAFAGMTDEKRPLPTPKPSSRARPLGR
ncbi:hypothetical protein, partial [Sphingopyxis sp. 2PD]|uniref:hypothetical protein n=1 Tax=Sphingopyxis sp. 2PD TaxID=2502196 RepID=UPI001BB21D9B